jgi:hypothetical protein
MEPDEVRLWSHLAFVLCWLSVFLTSYKLQQSNSAVLTWELKRLFYMIILLCICIGWTLNIIVYHCEEKHRAKFYGDIEMVFSVIKYTWSSLHILILEIMYFNISCWNFGFSRWWVWRWMLSGMLHFVVW